MKEKLFIVLLFVLATALGTLSHELGHFFASKYYGLNPTLHFDITEPDYSPQYTALIQQHRFVITLWGVLVTLIIGTIGFILTILYKRKIASEIFFLALPVLAFFYSREIFVFLISFFNGKFREPSLISGDEFKLALLLGWNSRSILIFLNVIAIFVCIYTIKLLPKEKRMNFLFFGFIGTIAGYFTWYKLLGPILLP